MVASETVRNPSSSSKEIAHDWWTWVQGGCAANFVSGFTSRSIPFTPSSRLPFWNVLTSFLNGHKYHKYHKFPISRLGFPLSGGTCPASPLRLVHGPAGTASGRHRGLYLRHRAWSTVLHHLHRQNDDHLESPRGGAEDCYKTMKEWQWHAMAGFWIFWIWMNHVLRDSKSVLGLMSD